MDSTVFKYKHHYQQQQQQEQHQHFNTRISNNNNNCSFGTHNNNNQNSIFILNSTKTKNILPNNPQLYYSALNENNTLSSSSSCAFASSSAAPSSVWSSASSTMCSPAAHALQKLFNCSSSSFQFNNGHTSGIESKPFKSKSEILKKKTKFGKYLENEDNDKNNQKGGIENKVENDEKMLAKGFKYKSNNCFKSIESEDRNHEDLSELLEYSCSLCDNCRCVDCQIGYFDCENSDDSNSEYSFHLSAYEEDEEADSDTDNDNDDNVLERQKELKTSRESIEDCCSENHIKQQDTQKSKINLESVSNCCCTSCCVAGDKQENCAKTECCQQCFIGEIDGTNPENFIITNQDH